MCDGRAWWPSAGWVVWNAARRRRMQADAVADSDSQSGADVDTHGRADVDVRAFDRRMRASHS